MTQQYLSYLSTSLQKINVLDFSIFVMFHLRIPVSIISSFRLLAGYRSDGFPLSLANISAMFNKRYLSGESMIRSYVSSVR